MNNRKNLPGKDYGQADLDDVTDNPAWTAADVKAAKPFIEAFPDLAASMRRGRGPAKKPTKERITLRIDRETLDTFRATGEGWQTRIGEALAKSAARMRKAG